MRAMAAEAAERQLELLRDEREAEVAQSRCDTRDRTPAAGNMAPAAGDRTPAAAGEGATPTAAGIMGR